MQQPQTKKKKAFTLVELIIVITILAILGTIAFISFQGYTKDTRDSVRLTDVKSIYDGLSIYKVQTSTTLLPDDYIEIQSGTTTISYQGYAGDTVQRGINLKNGGTDPLSKNYYIYTADVSAKKIQLMTYLETADKDVELLSYKDKLNNLNLINQAYSSNTDTGYYEDKKIYVYGDKIGILTDENNVPLQETTTSTGINLVTNTGNITTYFGGEVYDNGKSTNTGVTLINQINGAISNTIPCSATSYSGYTITSLQDSQSGSFIKPLTIENGSGTGTIVATCNNGVLSYGEENIENGCSNGYSLIGGECIINKFNLTGNITNGSGGTINLCGTNTSIDTSGNFSLPNINYGTNCSGINITREGYICSISTDGPNSLISNISNIAGSCSLQTLDITNSLRFNGNSSYLSRTFGNNGSGTTWTYSLWFKNSNPNLDQHLLGSYNGVNNFEDFDINSGMLDFRYYNGSTFSRHLRASGLLRDPSKWYHLVLVFDTNNNVESDRIRFYVDGNRINDLSIATYPTKGTSSYFINKSGFLTWIGRRIMAPQSEYLDGYLSEVNFIDGQALSASDFGVNIGGNRLPKTYTGIYGTNGFHLDFSDNINLGKDISGRNNNFSPSGFQTYDIMIDTPTNNFSILDINKSDYTNADISNGGLRLYHKFISGYYSRVRSSLSANSGKYYFEWKVEEQGGIGNQSAVYITNDLITSLNAGGSVSQNTLWGAYVDTSADLRCFINQSYQSPCMSISHNQVMGMIVDFTNGKYWIANRSNSTWYGGATDSDVINGLNPSGTFTPGTTMIPYFTATNSGTNKGGGIANFGQGGQSDVLWCAGAGGYFKYCPPAGFKTLSSKNIGN